MICAYVSMEEKKLNALQNLEKEIGQTLLAFNCHEMQPAQLTEEQIERIKAMEKELGVVIVAL